MIEYTDELTNKLFKKYEMLASSLNLLKDDDQKNNVHFEMGKILKQIIDITNNEYEEQYNSFKNKEVEGFDDEKTKLTLLIEVISDRQMYINSLLSKHYILTSKRIDEPSFLGKYDLDSFVNKIDIIDNYIENVNLINKYKEEINKIDASIRLAKEKIEISNAVNNELEVKLKNNFEKEFSDSDYYKLKDEKDEIDKISKELDFIIKISEENIKINNSLSYETDYDEQNDYEEIEELYMKFKEKKAILKLMDIYDKKAKNYDELIEKRNEINKIISSISNSNIFYKLNEFLKEQYSILLRQKEDAITLRSLEEEKKYKLSLIEEKEEENKSEIFYDIIEELKKEEEAIKLKKIEEQKKEEELNKKKLIEEQKIRQEEIKKRQKLIEEERKKEMEERAKVILQEQNKFLKKNDKVEKNIIEQADIESNPIFNDIKSEIELNEFLDKEDNYIGLNSLNNISNVLPNDLDDYIKKFQSNEKEEFDNEKIFVDF